jgi:hypothetical protein
VKELHGQWYSPDATNFQSLLMMEIITFFDTMKGKILGRLMDFEQRGKSSSRYLTQPRTQITVPSHHREILALAVKVLGSNCTLL